MVSSVVIPAAVGWVRGLWMYYRRYTDTTIHTAATAALAIFGLLVVIDPWFAAVAIACYIAPPLVLYVLADEPDHGTDADPGRATDAATTASSATHSSDDGASRRTLSAEPSGGETDTDSDRDDGDTDSDSDDGDTDSDADG